MRFSFPEVYKNEITLIGRTLSMLLWVIYGFIKLTHLSATASAMASFGMPLPWVSAIIAVIMEFIVGLAILFGICSRPLAFLLALYALATALIGHHFWMLTGQARADQMEEFFKNLGLMGGLLILCSTGAPRYSIKHAVAGKDLPAQH